MGRLDSLVEQRDDCGVVDSDSGKVLDFEDEYLKRRSPSERLAYHARLVDYYKQQSVNNGCSAVRERLQYLEDWLNQGASD